MYIKNIKISGFKSFADKTELDFEEGINEIVGPNGSGKSNVVDAILWVLGEQSVKTLRGDGNMSDVIFNGSKTRNAMNKASVAILFDNSDHSLAAEFNEVEIKRVIYQGGENEYYINNAKVRLKDITNILLDVTSKFNIITQGNITALVDNKSSERRTLFESAAGVLKYKQRKEDSLKRLDSTKENLTRIELIIKELNENLIPLESQKKDAEEYLNIKNNLENIEVALIAENITKYNEELSKLKLESERIQNELDDFTKYDNSKLEKYKFDSLQIDDEITNLNNKINTLTEEISSLNSEKQLTIERSKFNIDKSKINDEILELNENKLNLDRIISKEKLEIETSKNNLSKLIKDYNIKSDEELKSKICLTNYQNDKNKYNAKIYELQNKINIENTNIENNAFLPKSVSSILSNPRLEGIHNTIYNLIECNEAHETAIKTSLGASSNFIVVDNLTCAKKAINYLKDNNLGRATFFPIDIIKSRRLTKEILGDVINDNGFIGIASDLLKYDKKYSNIIENQLGNVLITDTVDDLLRLSKKLDFRYKMVSLEGEVIYPGGSISGGIDKGNITSKSTLNKLKKDLEIVQKDLLLLDDKRKKEESKYNLLESTNKDLSYKIASLRVEIEALENKYNIDNENLKNIMSNITSLSDTQNGTIDKRVEDLLNTVNNKVKEKDTYVQKLKDKKTEKFNLQSLINDEEKTIEKNISQMRKYENTINNNEVNIGKLEVKIDNELNILRNEYNMTYEKAKDEYTLSLVYEDAKNIVNEYRSKLKKFANVNLGAIEEYNRVKKRFDFLDTQKQDLEKSREELLEIISNMDDIMKDKFKKAFDEIAAEFSIIFRKMFKGGNGLLKLADENDLLNTGINILAVPPGKKLSSTAMLSGGEKSLTAICLIFAILSVKKVPYVVLDEVEAALDEENVNMFGQYLKDLDNKCQFIIITHKKKMMEYANILYGITMQESGVSKIVSVKLD